MKLLDCPLNIVENSMLSSIYGKHHNLFVTIVLYDIICH